MTTTGKRIILCSDGTGNSSSSVFKTNVWRLYQALDLSRPDQIAQYDDGVGTSSFKPLAILGGVFGIGLASNVRDLYAFVCRHYRPGDSIYGFGFSRGAFTIRVLSGLIASQGIVRYENEADLQRKVRRAYQDYRSRFRTQSVITRPIHDLLRWSRDRLLDIKDRLGGYKPYDRPELRLRKLRPLPDGSTAPREREEQAIREAGNRPAGIEFLGLWDTVDAYGLPIDEMTRAVDDYFWPLTMRDRELRPNVRYARQALALDDERNTFHPVLWKEDATHQTKPARDRRLLQVWFAGMHSNVGGGYPIDSLSHVPLIWMIDEIDSRKIGDSPTRRGLYFIETRVEAYRQSADPLGPISDSRAGFGAYYRFQPRRFPLLAREAPPDFVAYATSVVKDEVQRRFGKAKLDQKVPNDLGTPPAAQVTEEEDRTPYELEKPILHHSVVHRLVSGIENYAPIIIPPDARVIDKHGNLVDLDRYVAASNRLNRKDGPLQLASPVEQQKHQDVIDNLVWRRRVFYFLTLFTTLFFAAGPFYLETERTDGDDPRTFAWPSALAEAIGSYVPGFFKPWIDAYAANPWWFLSFAVLLFVLNIVGASLKAKINNCAGMAWRKAAAAGQNGMNLSPLGRMLAALRKSWLYIAVFRWLKGTGLPGLFAALFLLVGMAVVMQGWFNLTASPKKLVASATLDACRSQGALLPVAAGETKAASPFDTRCQAWPSRLRLQGGMRYEITLRLSPSAPEAGLSCPGNLWLDLNYPADPFGLYAPDEASWGWHAARHVTYFIGLPFRRHIDRPWFTLVAQSGEDGRAVTPLVPKVPPGRKPDSRAAFVSEFTAQRSGELFLYVNDAVNVLGLDFYANNCGQARVSLRPLDWDPAFNR
jgi:uncharacterized protein (DUF2235 family)